MKSHYHRFGGKEVIRVTTDEHASRADEPGPDEFDETVLAARLNNTKGSNRCPNKEV